MKKEELKNIDKYLDVYTGNYSKLEKDNKITYLDEKKTQNSNISGIDQLETDITNLSSNIDSSLEYIGKFFNNISADSINKFYNNVQNEKDDLKNNLQNFKKANYKNAKTKKKHLKRLKNQLDTLRNIYNIESSFIEIENLISKIKLDKNTSNKDESDIKNVQWKDFRDLIHDVKEYQKNDSSLNNMLMNLYRLINVMTRGGIITGNLQTLEKNINTISLNIKEPKEKESKEKESKEIEKYQKYQNCISTAKSRCNEIATALTDYYNTINKKFKKYKETHTLPKDDPNEKQTNEIETLINEIIIFTAENNEELTSSNNSNKLNALGMLFSNLKDLNSTKKYEDFLTNDIKAIINGDMKEILSNELKYLELTKDYRINIFEKCFQDFETIKNELTNNNSNKQKELKNEKLMKETKALEDIFQKPNINLSNLAKITPKEKMDEVKEQIKQIKLENENIMKEVKDIL